MPELDLKTALDDPASWQARALWSLQVPRVLQGLVAGATLALSGAALQGLLRNALADPFILGVSGGAALGSTAAVLTGLGAAVAAPTGGFLGALGALLLVTALASERGRVAPLRVLLVGVVFNALAGAGLMVLQAFADPGALQAAVFRLMGSVGADPSRPALLPILAGAFAVGLAAALAHARSLDVLALGDDTARSLGVDPDRLRLRLFVLLSVPIGAVVAVTGLIGFVGLIVPHAVRLALGPDHRALLPISALVGGAFVVVADAVVSALSPALGTELPVGVLTALVGGPLFLALLRWRPSQAEVAT
ncbi:MAG: iron ABC transporter permease [Deltaproteobacteria bacterium]|nr:iron ABC transporter permease [Deltaproteobacteria bacterium]